MSEKATGAAVMNQSDDERLAQQRIIFSQKPPALKLGKAGALNLQKKLANQIRILVKN